MPVPFRGNINGEVLSQSQNLPMLVEGFTLVNKTGGTIGVNVYLMVGGTEVAVMPLNKQLAAGEMYEATNQVIILATEQIKVQTSGSTDYNFYINNMEP